jgi:peptidoglycan/LPS O-acetylase OafA/YrhL
LKIKYLAGIDGLRAIAVLAVMAFHLDPTFLPSGFTGVDVFFVISGYVISKSLSQRTSSAFIPYILDFYKRRVIRILPALLVFLIVISLASTLFIPTSWLSVTSSKTGLGAFWGISNYMLLWHTDGYFSPRVDFNPFVHTWSLSVEEQFYLFFPFLLYISHRFQQLKTFFGLFSRSILLGLAMTSLGYAVYETTAHPDQAFYLLPSRFWELAAGALLFKQHSNNVFFDRFKGSQTVFFSLGFLLLVIGFIYSAREFFPFPWAIAPVLGTVLLMNGIASPSTQSSFLQDILESRLLRYIGKISYSLYLWHWGIYVLFRWTIGLDSVFSILIALILTFSLAILSYHFIESPVRNNAFFKHGKNWQVIVLSIITLSASYFISQKIFESQSMLSLSVTRDKAIWYPDAQPDITPSEDEIRLQIQLKGRKLFVVGDSHTMAYSLMLNEISTRLGIEVHQYPTGHCRPMSLLFSATQSDFCQKRIENIVNTIQQLSKLGDIVFFASLRMKRLCDQWNIVDVEKAVRIQNSTAFKQDQQLAFQQASTLIKRLNDKGLKVLIDAPKPVFKAPPFRCSDWFNQSNPICQSGMIVERDFLLEHRRSVVVSMKRLAIKHNNVSLWDPFFVLCKNETCSAFDGDKPLFFDGDHLSGHGNRVLIPSFKQKILDIFSGL